MPRLPGRVTLRSWRTVTEPSGFLVMEDRLVTVPLVVPLVFISLLLSAPRWAHRHAPKRLLSGYIESVVVPSLAWTPSTAALAARSAVEAASVPTSLGAI